MRWSLAVVMVRSCLFSPRTRIERIEWLRDECSFMSCAPTALGGQTEWREAGMRWLVDRALERVFKSSNG